MDATVFVILTRILAAFTILIVSFLGFLFLSFSLCARPLLQNQYGGQLHPGQVRMALVKYSPLIHVRIVPASIR